MGPLVGWLQSTGRESSICQLIIPTMRQDKPRAELLAVDTEQDLAGK
jgi:hypothetical protein